MLGAQFSKVVLDCLCLDPSLASIGTLVITLNDPGYSVLGDLDLETKGCQLPGVPCLPQSHSGLHIIFSSSMSQFGCKALFLLENLF